jgi:hypothetical protein
MEINSLFGAEGGINAPPPSTTISRLSTQITYDPNLNTKLTSANLPSIANEDAIKTHLYAFLQEHNYFDKQLDFNVFKAFLKLESGGRIDKISNNSLGATGIIQLTPSVAKDLFTAIRNTQFLRDEAVNKQNNLISSAIALNLDTMVNFDIITYQMYMNGLTIDQQIFLAKVYFWKWWGNGNDKKYGWDAGRMPMHPINDFYAAYSTLFCPAYLHKFYLTNPDDVVLYDLIKSPSVVTGNYIYSNSPKDKSKATIITIGTFKNGSCAKVKSNYPMV